MILLEWHGMEGGQHNDDMIMGGSWKNSKLIHNGIHEAHKCGSQTSEKHL